MTLAQGNAFYGSQAGANNTSGNLNTFIGASAGRENTTGNSNTAVGFAAGINNRTLSYNTSIGAYAGYSNNSSFGENIFIGYRAGFLEPVQKSAAKILKRKEPV